MHYHSTCYGCLTPDEAANYTVSLSWEDQEMRKYAQVPGGVAFATEEMARNDADTENAATYMRGWVGHHQVVAPCMGMHCRPYTTSHKVEWQRQVEGN